MSRDCVNNLAFNEKQEGTSWEDCSLKKWINKSFIEDAFSKDLAANILDLKILEDGSYTYVESSGEKSKDMTHILSMQTVKVLTDMILRIHQ